MMQGSPSEFTPRDAALDGLRGIAILLVICVHCFRFAPDNSIWIWLNNFCRSGWLGVDLFFVLSGFLITRILIRTRETPYFFRNFYARRTLRIFPAYYLYLALVFLVLPEINPTVREAQADSWAPYFLLFIPNIAMVAHADWSPWIGLDHLWSLAVEEQFYLLWPLVVWLTPLRRLGQVCIGAILLAWGCKALLLTLDSWKYTPFILMPTRMDGLAAGAWVAVHYQTAGGRAIGQAARVIGLAAASAMLVLFFYWRGLILHPATHIVVITSLAALAFAGGIKALMAPGESLLRRCVSAAPLRFFGKYSYGLYLLHFGWNRLAQESIHAYFARYLDTNWAVLSSGVLTLAGATASAVLMFHLFEMPFLRLKRHFERSGEQK